jgi:hypothetical protein
MKYICEPYVKSKMVIVGLGQTVKGIWLDAAI